MALTLVERGGRRDRRPSSTPITAGTRASTRPRRRARPASSPARSPTSSQEIMPCTSRPRFTAQHGRRAVALAGDAVVLAQPQFGNPSPTAGSATSQKAKPGGRPGGLPAGRVRQRGQAGPGAGGDPGRDQEQQRDVHREVQAEQHRRLRARSSCPAPTSRCWSAATWARCCASSSSPTTWATRSGAQVPEDGQAQDAPSTSSSSTS